MVGRGLNGMVWYISYGIDYMLDIIWYGVYDTYCAYGREYEEQSNSVVYGIYSRRWPET